MNQQPKTLQTILLVAVLALVLVVLSSSLLTQNGSRLAYSDVLDLFENERVESFVLQGDTLTLTLYGSDAEQAGTATAKIGDIETFHKDLDETIAAQNAAGVLKSYNYLPAANSIWKTALPYLLVGIALLFVWFILMNRSGSGPNAMAQFTRANARFGVPSGESVTFQDVAGADEEKEELSEIVEFLRDPDRFKQLGAKIPKGVLLVGPPGTGKTLLARAVAGEANVAFLSISGSDFVELYVGVGASRVRDLFEQAKRVAPAIVFIDEIDAVGRQRGAGLGGGHDEREQTLNQLLVEMDGFSANEGVIVIAATNRKDILDPALLRPGRFDRQIYVGAPDWRGRLAILQVHARKKPLADNVDLPAVAKATAGFTGADLANLLNEGALLAARRGKAAISEQDLETSMIKVIAGPEKKSRMVSHAEKMLTAVHEAGHAICMYCLDSQDPVHLITIIPRAQAGGMTISLPRTTAPIPRATRCLRPSSPSSAAAWQRRRSSAIFPPARRTICSAPPASPAIWSQNTACPTASAPSATRAGRRSLSGATMRRPNPIPSRPPGRSTRRSRRSCARLISAASRSCAIMPNGSIRLPAS